MHTFRVSTVFENAALSVSAVERADIRCDRSNGGIRCYASLKPVAIVVHSDTGAYALDTEGGSIDFEELRQSLPERLTK